MWAAVVDKVQNHPVIVSEAVRQILIVGMGFGLLQWDQTQLALVLSSFSAILALFARQSTTANPALEQKVQERVAYREAVTKSGTSGI